MQSITKGLHKIISNIKPEFALLYFIFYCCALVNLLSAFSAINRAYLFIGALPAIVVVASIFVRSLFNFSWQIFNGPKVLLLFLVPMLVLILISGLSYPPNNYDSMAYHLARIVYWLQNHSVAYYQTYSSRQVVLTPGAEYVLLVVQGILNSDVIDFALQFISYILSLYILYRILSILEIKPEIKIASVILAATAPMAILQASSTQNDMVASYCCMCIIYSLILINKAPNENDIRYHCVNLVLSLCLGYLVKPTAVIAAIPFVIVYGVNFLRKPILKSLFAKPAPSILILLILCATIIPDFARKVSFTGSLVGKRHEVFSLTDPIGIKLQNVVKSIGHSTPWDATCFRFHEDYAGNPIQMAAFLLSIMLLLSLLWKLKSNLQIIAVLPIASWIVFHMVVKDQPFIVRLQSPVFFIMPITIGIVFTHIKNRYIFIVLSLFSLANIIYGTYVSAMNESRKPKAYYILHPRQQGSYYNNNPYMESQHDSIIRQINSTGCKKLGIIGCEGSYEYPLTWLMYRQGITTYQILDSSDRKKACVILVDTMFKSSPEDK